MDSSPPTSHPHMLSPQRIFTPYPSYPIPRTYRYTTRGCEVSSFPRLLESRTHYTTARILINTATLSLYPSFVTHISPPSPYSPNPSHSRSSSPAVRCHSAKAGSLTRAMPNSRKAKGASREVEISKSLSYLLRHGAKIEKITLDEAGWANVADVVCF